MEYIFSCCGKKISARHWLWMIAGLCLGFIGFALFLQHFRHVAPCPLCVLQRYAFLAIALFCLIGVLLDSPRIGAALACLSALSGAGIAAWQLWTALKPGLSCGLDPQDTFVNRLWPAQWLPSVFWADGTCSGDNGVILGLSTPQWGLFWFVTLALALAWIMLRRGGKRDTF